MIHLSCKIFRIDAVVHLEVVCYVDEEDQNIDNVRSRHLGIVHDHFDVVETRSTQSLDVLCHDVAISVLCDSGDITLPSLARADAGKEDQATDLTCIRIGANSFWRVR